MLDLTQSQKKFVFSDDKFIRLLAPAGCGKTSVIIEKTKNIYANHPKSRIAIFTFTKGAANEIKERCDKDVSISVSTLNSWGNDYIKLNCITNAKLVNKHSDKILCVNHSLRPVWSKKAYEKTFKPLLTGRGKDKNFEMLMDLIDGFKNIGFVHKLFDSNPTQNLEIYNNHLEYIKKVGLERYYDALIESLVHALHIKEENKNEHIVKLCIRFWKDCVDQMQATGFYTYDDQKYLANIVLSEKVKNGEKWNGAAKIDYIFIDEFQDISPLDSMLISNLQKLNNSGLIIVGDDDQAIYEFRGASPYFILHPEEIFNQTFSTYILEENFRSPQNIVTKATKLISFNKNRVQKNVVSVLSDDDAEINVLSYNTQEEMVDAVINHIKEIVNNTDENVAVLSRLKASLLPYQILLTKDNIQYKVSEDLAFFLTGAAKNLNTVMQIKANNNYVSAHDLVELVCLNSRTEIYDKLKNTLNMLFLQRNANKDNVYDVIESITREYPDVFKHFNAEFIMKCKNSLKQFFEAENVYDTLHCLLNDFDGLQQNYSRSLEDLYYRDPPLSSLLDFASKYADDYAGFLKDFNDAMLAADAAYGDTEFLSMSNRRVFLSTALRVKGQQFDNVIVLNTIDDTWPKKQAKTSDNEYEAERRLFYVATTRSKKSLSMYWSKNYHDESTIISPFILEGEFLG